MKRYSISVNGVPYDVVVSEAGAAPAAVSAPAAAPVAAQAAAVPAPAPAPAAGGAKGSIVISAPMPGTVLDIRVSVGQQVKSGDVLIVLEAMKMENEIVAAQDATVSSVDCSKGDMVNVGDVFLTLS